MSENIKIPEAVMTPPNHEYADLHRVIINAKKGSNEQCRLVASDDGTEFSIIRGQEGVRVGPNKPRKFGPFAIEDFDKEYQNLLRQGFRLSFDTPPAEGKLVTEGNYAPMPDAATDRVIKELVKVSKQCFEELFTVSTKRIAEVPESSISDARAVVDAMAAAGDSASVKEFNGALTTLYEILPRRIDNIWQLVARTPEDFPAVIARETAAIDQLEEQIRMAQSKQVIKAEKPDICTAHGLDVRPVTAEEKEEILDHLHGDDNGDRFDKRSDYIAAWRVTNHKTMSQFNDYCARRGIGTDDYSHGKTLLWHGSGTENYWSIMLNGLILHPNANLCGAAYGHGTYFAPSAEKSGGYTSGSGRWRAADGTMSSFLTMFDVATGEIYDINREGGAVPDNAEELEKLHPGADCLWAYGRQSGGWFLHDEVVVYRECQSTMKYLVEIKA